MENRSILLKKIYSALKPNGKFILDVFTTVQYFDKTEKQTWEYFENGGFWNEKPHLCLESVYHYDEDITELRQYIIQTQENIKCYNIWEHFFTKESLTEEVQKVGFKEFELYGDITGKNI